MADAAYRLTKAAADDLRQIYVEGVRLFGADVAARYHARLKETFGLLADNPKMARERREISPPVRIHPCGSHVIVYVIDTGSILILRVRHGREDWAREDEA